jgi:CRISPR-associated protein Cmr6
LLLQRYLSENATGESGNPEEKQDILRAAINAATDCDVRELYKIAYQRWQNLLPSSSVTHELHTIGRLIVGLGSENVLETGIRLHHTFGMPIIPGSALKGLAAHYCDQVWGATGTQFKKEGPYHELLFGTTDDCGCIVFHDAWFVPDLESNPLKLDVMTPHHPKWFDGSEPPTDFDSPIPVPFLSVSGGFRVAVTWHGPEHQEANNWTDLAFSLLKEALSEWGIGGKTTSGYGRLDIPPPPPPPSPYKGKATDTVDTVLLREKTKKGGWRAQIKGHSQIGPIQNSDQVPVNANSGDTVRLVIASINDGEAAFKWP